MSQMYPSNLGCIMPFVETKQSKERSVQRCSPDNLKGNKNGGSEQKQPIT